MSLLAAQPFPIFMRDLPHRSQIYYILTQIQARNPLNTNVLLFSIWFAVTEQGRLRRPEFKKLEAVLHPWHERIVEALQQLADSLNQTRLLLQWVAAEVDTANQFEQQMLAQALPVTKKSRRSTQQQLIDASHNLVTYFKTMRIHVDDNVREYTLQILRLFFRDCPEDQITQTLDQAINAARLEDSGFMQLSLV